MLTEDNSSSDGQSRASADEMAVRRLRRPYSSWAAVSGGAASGAPCAKVPEANAVGVGIFSPPKFNANDLKPLAPSFCLSHHMFALNHYFITSVIFAKSEIRVRDV